MLVIALAFCAMPMAAQKAISVESFSEIVLTGRLNVELKIADKEEVIIETKGIEVEDIGVNVKGGVLRINALKAFKNKNIDIGYNFLTENNLTKNFKLKGKYD